MRAIFRRRDGTYLDNEQSWVRSLVDTTEKLMAQVLAKHGGEAADYAVFETAKPWFKKLSRGKLIDDKSRLAKAAESADAEQKVLDLHRRIERRRLETDLKLAQEAGDKEAVKVLKEQIKSS